MKVNFTPLRLSQETKLLVVVEPETNEEIQEIKNALVAVGIHPDEWLDTGIASKINYDMRFLFPTDKLED